MTATPSLAFRDLLRRSRRALGLTQEELAERAGVSARLISALESAGGHRPRKDTLQLLAAALELSSEERIEFAAAARRARASTGGSDAGPNVGQGPTISAPQSQVPVEVTSFIGREAELASICSQLRRPEVRLLTLTGMGGSGKTRLATRVGGTVAPEFRDGVAFIDLAPLSDASLVAGTIGEALGIKEQGALSPFQALIDSLRERHQLLILDNFEHLVEAANTVAGILDACPRITALVTSRITLHLRAERLFEVSPLRVPAATSIWKSENFESYEAVALFVERTRAVKPDFSLNAGNAEAIAGICRNLDGIPLALELAAARMRLFSPQRLLDRLSNRLQILVGEWRDVPDRQQTLRNTIDWSYQLLDESERNLFARLSVFAGGWTLAAAEALCELGQNSDKSVLDVLSSLIDKSLLYTREQADGELRFVMLQTIREYASERLRDAGEAPRIQQAHLEYWVSFAEQVGPELVRTDQSLWFVRLDVEHDNLRAALRYALDRHQIELGLRLLGAIWRFWWMRGHLTEGRRWLDAFLSAATPDSPGLDHAIRARALNVGGILAQTQDDHLQAMRLFTESLTLRRRLDDQSGIAACLGNLGSLAIDTGDFERAAELYGEALALRRTLGDRRGIATALHNLGAVRERQLRFEEATVLYEQSLAMRREMNDTWGIASTLSNMGNVALYRGAPKRAVALLHESLALQEQLGDAQGMATTINRLGRVAWLQGARQSAPTQFGRSLALYHHIGDRLGVAEALEGLAAVTSRDGDREEAAQLLGAANRVRDAIGVPRPAGEDALYGDEIRAISRAMQESELSEPSLPAAGIPVDRIVTEVLHRLQHHVESAEDDEDAPRDESHQDSDVPPTWEIQRPYSSGFGP